VWLDCSWPDWRGDSSGTTSTRRTFLRRSRVSRRRRSRSQSSNWS